jgi:hypothetical protein
MPTLEASASALAGAAAKTLSWLASEPPHVPEDVQRELALAMAGVRRALQGPSNHQQAARAHWDRQRETNR